ncbi:MAG: EAL domain-containing protein [Candidatus Dormibacteraeota bacterium]|nr:EAL domain-containing protein [Candidatus Dormibacteraeota bacterium]
MRRDLHQRAPQPAAGAPGRPTTETEHDFRALFDASPQPMFVLDLRTFRYRAVNDAALVMYGYTRQEFLELEQTDLRVEGRVDQLEDDRHALTTGTKKHFHDTQHRTKDGRILDVEIDVGDVRFAGGPAVVVVVSDVTQRVSLQDELEYQAFHDALTGLPNRALFTDRLDHALARGHRDGQSLAVLFLDLDNFKTINDGLGHSAGDELLCLVARRLHEQLRSEDTAARFGGDEFAVLIENASDAGQVARVCERIAAALSVECHIAGTKVSVQASIGVTYGSDGLTSHELLRNADVAMYRAKENGKGCFQVFEPSMHERVAQRLQMESDLRRGLEEGGMRLHYQPVLSLPGRRVVGVEALVRWMHPERGIIPPLEFIGLAEETGLILPMGRWVIREACRQVRRWQREIPGLDDLKAGVNLSPRQLDDPALLGEIERVLADTGLQPTNLILEITENAFARDPIVAATRLRQLSALGVKLAIDDFGTGQSSLAQLRRFPVNILKIDKAFVDPVGEDAAAGDLLRAMHNVGTSLGLDVVLEGIETAAQDAVVERLDGVFVQGYLYSRPQDAETMTAFLTQRSAATRRAVA